MVSPGPVSCGDEEESNDRKLDLPMALVLFQVEFASLEAAMGWQVPYIYMSNVGGIFGVKLKQARGNRALTL